MNDNLIIDRFKSKKVDTDKAETIYEYEPHANFFIIRRFDIAYRQGAYKCVPSVKLCVLSQIKMDWMMALNSVIPDKFYFSHVVYYNKLTTEDSNLIKAHCHDLAMIDEDRTLKMSAKDVGFDENVSSHLDAWSDKGGVLVFAPWEWVAGFIKGKKGKSSASKDCAMLGLRCDG